MRNSASATATAKGIGFAGLLTVAFVVLKLCGIIQWSWIWVLSPIWISVILWVIFFVILYKIYKIFN